MTATDRPGVAFDDPTLDDEDLPPVVTTFRPRRTNRGRVAVVSVAFVLVLGFLLYRGLGNAAVYFRTADEAVAQKHQLGHKRFRVEGIVENGSVVDKKDGELLFSIYGDRGTVVPVVHTGGQPTGLFKDNIPVVLEGRWSDDGSVYLSDRVIVKHDESYKADNPDRVKDYATIPAASGS